MKMMYDDAPDVNKKRTRDYPYTVTEVGSRYCMSRAYVCKILVQYKW